MSDKLKDLWRKFSLTEEEQIDVIVEKDWLEEVAEVGDNCLIGKMMLNKWVNVEAMKIVLRNVWKTSSVMSIRELGDRMFVLRFEDIMENERVLMRQP